jgi:Holliday junction DNA helicase RuvB
VSDERAERDASRLGLPARTVADVYEPFLLRQALICKDDGGRRQLTADGRLHLSHYHNDSD